MASWRYIAQRVLTGEFLDLDLPLERDELTWTLSGAGSLRATVSPDTGVLRAADGRLLLEEWGTLLYAEADGQIRWGGIVVSSSFNDETWTVEAAGFATYPHGLPFGSEIQAVGIDPREVFHAIWGDVQSHPDGNLGVVDVGPGTPVRLGKAAAVTETPPQDTDGDGKFDVEPKTDVTPAEPYVLAWWETTDCGTEIDNLAKQTPFDYVERHYWSGNSIAHEMVFGYPRMGRRRADLAFVQGANITAVVTPTIDGDEYANEVVGLGAGEGQAALRRTTAVRDGRLRRTFVYTDKGVADEARMDSLIRGELTQRQNALEITSVTVRNHPNAPLGSWELGDDVLIQATIPWLGDVSLWCRITAWSLLTEDTATLTLARSDSFRYGG